tara:strand:- start:637 stop:1002 length:366 start_codon:yes stop_codon:yes gene_type:complete
MDSSKKKYNLFLEGLILFNNKQFYEAHEYWEELWLEHHLEDKKFIQGLIQLTVAYYHLSTGNSKGALSLLNKSLDKIQLFVPRNRGMNIDLIVKTTKESIEMVDGGVDFNWDIVPTLEVEE